METDAVITLASLASFFVLLISWVALPHSEKRTAVAAESGKVLQTA